ncbi:DUF4142 domain-containing protein [Bordetella sp. LUAb4]|uniref:DUF4142 domain-containing protein n=1 Tax=Bordetella sp. LUAb4 TaxID=2843195 RepID=UPI001E48C9AB|nr:DUF4142 domain-containing protein [Bordetella sp. LUAb4]
MWTKQRSAVVVLSIATCLGTPWALAQRPASTAAGQQEQKLDAKDRGFLDDAARAGLFEMAGSKLALQKSGSADIKTFAERMIKDHIAMSRDLATLAKSKGYALPGEPGTTQKLELKALDVADSSFDTKFAERIGANAHTHAMNVFAEAAKEAKDPDVKEFAKKYLPMMKEHLRLAEGLEGRAARAPSGRFDTPAR